MMWGPKVSLLILTGICLNWSNFMVFRQCRIPQFFFRALKKGEQVGRPKTEEASPASHGSTLPMIS